MPTRPHQSSEEQTRRWAERRASVGARIRELRLEQALSQEALALESGLSRNMIIGIEWGKKSVAYERLWDIADVLEVPVSQLLLPPGSAAGSSPYRGGRRPMGA
ncbi:helix-turn-helix domain-containing protein [Arthrobacter sp. P2b]|uniref:helix-turn-helix domain-containing protein n=1 Tax=Arthrobacter sp. P2b TaxID=1938741 RepID=UPI0009A7B3B9